MYYEMHGAGFPLVLLHGGLSAIGTSFGKLLPGLARRSPEAIASIKVPTLLIAGDCDIVRPEHVVELFRLLGGGVPGDTVGLPHVQLAVLPGTTHITLVDRTQWLLPMITGFLDASDPV
jgi:pimeloyl-ACP methyl ester carboxylesterase